MVQIRKIVWCCAFLLALTWLVYGQTLGHDFVNYDDRVYVTQNPLVQSGLTWSGLAAAFTQPLARNWHPLTMISHMLDCQMFGLKPAGHHFVNVLLHAIAACLLFFVWQRMTGSIWRSAFVAAVFAVHPLHVESVAWIAERKDVLSAVSFMLTLGAYARYAEKPSAGRYLIVLFAFACGLMSKPMLVTVPVVLMLLDYWPLKRRGAFPSVPRLIWEKIPLFALSVASAITTFIIQRRTAGSSEALPLAWRINNSIVSCVTYIGQMFWPVNLSVFYPHPENHLAIWQVVLAGAFLVAVTVAVYVLRRSRPYLLVGWLWYLVMLVPVIGIIQVGLQGHADRYTYLPQIGLFVAVTWLVADWARALAYRRQVLALVSLIIVALLSACAWRQTASWRNSESLWTHALKVTPSNEVAETNLGLVLLERGKTDEAIAHFQSALSILSQSRQAHYNLSLALVYTDLGNALLQKGQFEEAIAHLAAATQLQPDYPDAYYNLGSAFFQRGRVDEAISQWQKSVSLRPDDAEARTSLGNAFLQKGSLGDGIAQYEEALRIAPNSILPMNNLAWVLATSPDARMRNGVRAVNLARRAVQLSEARNPIFIRTLGAALAEAGRFEPAQEAAERAEHLARTQRQPELAEEIEKEIDGYRRGIPIRDDSLTNAETSH